MNETNMEIDEDMFVVIVGDETDEEKDSEFQSETNNLAVEELIEKAEKHGEILPIELNIEDKIVEYVEEETLENEPLTIDFPTDYREIPTQQRRAMIKPYQRRSVINELRENFQELSEDVDLLLCVLCAIMGSVKPPPPPQDYFIMNNIMFECIECGAMRETISAAARHYQEKHGARYLTCYACGVDFKSTTTLYKHEKRCRAPDAPVMLKARALYLGRKGRSRPYLTKTHSMRKYLEAASKTSKSFSCRQCSAVFANKSSLQSHLHLHSGRRPYRCRLCGAAYTSSSALSRHSQKHLDAEYTCDHCSRSFKAKQTLVAHMDTHKPLRKFPCEMCGRRFAQKMALKLHIDKKHLNLPPPCACQLCPKRFAKMSILREHMQNSHEMCLITRNMFFKRLPTLTEAELNEAQIVLKPDLAKVNKIVLKADNNVHNTPDDFNKQLELIRNYKETDVTDVKLVVIQNGEIVSSDDVQVKEELFLDVKDIEHEGMIEEFQ